MQDHQDQSMEFTSNERGGVHLHTLVDRVRKCSRENNPPNMEDKDSPS